MKNSSIVYTGTRNEGLVLEGGGGLVHNLKAQSTYDSEASKTLVLASDSVDIAFYLISYSMLARSQIRGHRLGTFAPLNSLVHGLHQYGASGSAFPSLLDVQSE